MGEDESEQVLAGVTRLGFTETLLPTGRATQAGTYLYMAPELLAGKSASPSSDIYSLGVVLFQMLVGDFSRPITTDWAKEIADAVLREDLARCTAGNPPERFSHAGELAGNLRNWEKRRLERELAETRKHAEEESRQRQIAEEHTRQLEAAYAKVSETVTRLQIQRAEELFATGDSDTALAYLARILRKDPNNRVAAARLLSDLSFREIALPIGLPIKHEGEVRSAEFSPDGNRIVTASSDHTARLWDARTGDPISPPLQHEDHVFSVSFSPDGKTLVTASGETARLWDAHSGLLRTTPWQHPWPVSASPGSARTVSGWSPFPI